MTSLASKTVILMDHTPFLFEPGGAPIEIDVGGLGSSRLRGREREWGYISSFLPPVMKTLWTSAVENVIEYARIVYDVFAEERLLRILLCQSTQGQVTWLNSWETDNGNGNSEVESQQSLAHITEAFANAGRPPAISKHNALVGNITGLKAGFKTAVDGLSQPSPVQVSMMNSSLASGKGLIKPLNRGRVICITSCTADALGQVTGEHLEDIFLNIVASQNRVAASSDHLLPIVECELVILSLHPLGKENLSRVLSRPLHDISSSIRSEVYVVTTETINDRMVDICTAHHDLVTSTVTNIPMKEEQNAVSSSNYDVPLFHAKMPTTTNETRSLKWSTPSAAKKPGGLCPDGMIPHCASATRITPVDVNSRPSTCLSNFVVNGRSVWLEIPAKKGKPATHVLTPHGTEMWMHVMESRNTLEDLPAISEGVGGRVTDYRIADFVNFIQANTLVPYPPGSYHLEGEKDRGNDPQSSFVSRRRSSLEETRKPQDFCKSRLNKRTIFWPLTISSSVLFSMSAHIDKILALIPNETLSEIDKVECDKVIWALMALEARGDGPPVPSSHFKKGMKRDDQWKMVYGELETFIRANLHSEMHVKVLECLLESRNTDKNGAQVSDPRLQDSSGNGKDLDGASDLKNLTLQTPKSPVVTDSPMSPPMGGSTGVGESMDHSGLKSSASISSKPNLLTLWVQKTEKTDMRALPSGMKLYPHIAAANPEQDVTSGSKSGRNKGQPPVEA